MSPRLALLLPLTIAACTPGPAKNSLRTRAAFDLQCPEGQVTIVKLGEDTRGVRGCGQQATYVRSCSHDQGCNWVMNNSVKPKRERED